jgi:hypothetical protein
MELLFEELQTALSQASGSLGIKAKYELDRLRQNIIRLRIEHELHRRYFQMS